MERAKQNGLVRPYVLNAGGRAHARPTHRATSQRLVRGDRSALDWTGDLSSQRWPEPEPAPEPARCDELATPPASTQSLPAEKPGRNHRVVPRERRQAEARWLVAIGGVAAFGIAGGLIMLLSQPSKLLAGTCGTESCRQGVSRSFGDAMPPMGAPALTHKAVHHADPTAPYSPAKPSPQPSGSQQAPSPRGSSPGPRPTRSSSTSPHPTSTTTAPSSSPAPSPTPTSTPTPGPNPVQVSYTVVRQHPHSFQAKFTIVNNGSAAINGWELAVVLPDDHVRSVWDGQFRTDGDILYIDPPSSQQTIAPGATLTENFIAGGSNTTPTSCMFNGSTC